MPPSDRSLRSAWGVLAAGILIVLAVLAVLAVSAHGAPWRVSWSITPPQVGVSYRVVKLGDGSILGETTGDSLVVDASPGDKLAVIAFNEEFGEAPPSDPIEIPAEEAPPADPPMVRIRVYQLSADLKTRREIATLYVPKRDRDFYQLGIEMP
jgi:hypothetical protein